MFSSSTLKKFFIIYLTVLSISIAFIVIFFSSYLGYIADVAQNIGHNSIVSNDQFSLKQNVLPLLSGDIVGIKILNAHEKLVFEFDKRKARVNYDYSHAVVQNQNRLYTIIIKTDLNRFFFSLVILSAFYTLLLIPFSQFEAFQKKNFRNSLLASVAKKIAHDIKSPLSTLSLTAEKIENDEIRSIQKAVIDQINKLSQDILNLHKSRTNVNLENHPIPNVKNEELIISKNQTYGEFFKLIQSEYLLKRNTLLRNFSFSVATELWSMDIKNEKFLYPMTCNFINNAIEATEPYSGQIDLEAVVVNNTLVLNIKDNGKGIPDNILKQLGKKEISFGKDQLSASGNGLAIFNARSDLNALNGSLEIESELGVFTIVKIKLPI